MKIRVAHSPGSPSIPTGPRKVSGFGAQPITPVPNLRATRVIGAKPSVAPGRVVRPSAPAFSPYLPPVHFFAEAIVNAGAEATLRSEAISNRTGRPVEIHEIRLAAWIDPQSAIASYDMGGPLRLRMAMNGKALTNAFVPFWLLGKTEQQPSQVFVGNSVIDDAAAGASVIYVWRLSKPWYLPPGALVEATFQNTGALKDPLHAMIGLAGRYVNDRRSTSHIPFAASYISKSFGYTDVDFDESSERDLVNSLSKDLDIDRIIARVGTLFKLNGTTNKAYLDYGNQGPFEALNLRIMTSTNLPIIKDYSSFRAIFGYSRAIDMKHSLKPGDFYRVGIQKIAGDVGPNFDEWQAQAFVSILGSREEAV